MLIVSEITNKVLSEIANNAWFAAVLRCGLQLLFLDISHSVSFRLYH